MQISVLKLNIVNGSFESQAVLLEINEFPTNSIVFVDVLALTSTTAMVLFSVTLRPLSKTGDIGTRVKYYVPFAKRNVGMYIIFVNATGPSSWEYDVQYKNLKPFITVISQSDPVPAPIFSQARFSTDGSNIYFFL